MFPSVGNPNGVLVATMEPQEQEVDELDDEQFESDDEDDPNVFKIRNVLNNPTYRWLSTRELHDMVHDAEIDLSPPYQRDVVWPESKQIHLIDSIYRNIHIPPVVLAKVKDDEGVETRVCIDGKQRLTSIQKFLDGQIPHRDPVTKKSFWFTASDSARTTRSEIPEKWKDIFRQKLINCAEYDELPPGADRELFQRVQLGMTLTAAEKLQAIASPWSEWISELEARHVAVEGGLSHVLQWDTKRGRDFQNIAHLVFCCDGLPNQLLPTAQKIEKWISRVDSPSLQFKKDIEEVLRSLWIIASSSEFNDGFTRITQRLAPVEFIFIGVLLYQLRKQSREVQGKAIEILRSSIRQEYRDIRNNTDVGRSMWNYIDSLRAHPKSQPIIHNHEASKGSGKRKRKDQDEEDEYRPAPVKSLGKPIKTRAKAQKS